MRMWKVAPELLCRKHLLGEHVEMHMFVASINKGRWLWGFRKLVETNHIQARHDELVKEMEARGYKHNSPMDYKDELNFGSVDVEISRAELSRRCEDCKRRIDNEH